MNSKFTFGTNYNSESSLEYLRNSHANMIESLHQELNQWMKKYNKLAADFILKGNYCDIGIFEEKKRLSEFYQKAYESEKDYTEKLKDEIKSLKQLISSLNRQREPSVTLPDIRKPGKNTKMSLVADENCLEILDKVNSEGLAKSKKMPQLSSISNRDNYKPLPRTSNDYASGVSNRESAVNRVNKSQPSPFRKTLMHCDYVARNRGNRQIPNLRRGQDMHDFLPAISKPIRPKRIEHIVTMAKGSGKQVAFSKSK